MSKQITITAKPGPAKSAEDWVLHRDDPPADTAAPRQAAPPGPAAPPMKRLTIDIPAELHARIKSRCALRRTKMNDEIRALLDEHFPA